MFVLVLVGEDRVGKDAIADHFLPRGDAARLALGDRLREVVRESLPVGRRDLTDDKDRPIAHLGGITGRDIMRMVGRVLREVEPNVWAIPVAMQINDLATNGYTGLVIVTDVREPGDLALLRDTASGKVRAVRIVRTDKRPSSNAYEARAYRCPVDYMVVVPGASEGAYSAAAVDLENYLRAEGAPIPSTEGDGK